VVFGKPGKQKYGEKERVLSVSSVRHPSFSGLAKMGSPESSIVFGKKTARHSGYSSNPSGACFIE
jgi:hypothetical protein